MTRLTNDITQVQNVITMGLKLMLRAPGMLIGAVIMAFVMNAELAMILLIIIPVLAAAIGTVIFIAFPRFEIVQKKIDAVNSRIQEMLTNIRIIKSFVRDEFETEKFAIANEELKQSGLSAFKVVILNMPIMMLAMNITTLAVVWVGGRQVLAGTMPVGDLTAFTTYIVQVLMSLMMLAMVLLQSSRAVASLKRITEILDTEIDLTDEEACRKDAVITRGDVEFRNVSFSYFKDGREGREKVLSDISFHIKAGETVGIIGSTGCGNRRSLCRRRECERLLPAAPERQCQYGIAEKRAVFRYYRRKSPVGRRKCGQGDDHGGSVGSAGGGLYRFFSKAV